VAKLQQPGSGPSAGTGSDSTRKQRPPGHRKGPSVGAIVLLVVGFCAVAAGVFYKDELRTYVLLRPWSKAGPRGAVDAFVAALEANDADAVRGLMSGKADVLVNGDRITGLRPPLAYPGMPPVKPESLTQVGPAAAGRIEYSMRATYPAAFVILTPPSGGWVRFATRPVDGEWRIVDFLVGGQPDHAE